MNFLRRAVANRKFILLLGIGFLCVVSLVGTIYFRASRALREAEVSIDSERHLRFSGRVYTPPVNPGFEPVSAPAAFSDAVQFQGRLFVAGPTELTEYDSKGLPLKHYRVGSELPASVLLRLAATTASQSEASRLVIATADAGLLFFDGKQFRQMLPEMREARAVTTVLPTGTGRLLVGTQKMGLLVYDGRTLVPFHPALSNTFVTELWGTESELWVGTQDRGVAHFHGGAVDWFGEKEGLPDARVYSIAGSGENVYVGTAAGIAEFRDGRLARVLAAGSFVRALLPHQDSLMAGTMDDGLLEIPLKGSRGGRAANANSNLPEVQRFFVSGDAVYAMTSGGVFLRSTTGVWKQVLRSESGTLADRNISALALDQSGRLWVGYFDRGLDVIGANGTTARHFEDEHLFCINRIVPDNNSGGASIATANGLVLVDQTLVPRKVVGTADGLIAQHVTDLASLNEGLAVATPAGITFLDGQGTRSMNALYGLVNNHVYTIAANGSRLLVGTLGGATVLEGDQARVSYTTATSGLKHNWITAAVPVEDGWWIGTYGGGVEKVDFAGKVTLADGTDLQAVINPNAMLTTNRLVLAGTMGKGLFVMDRASERWVTVTDGLPSMNVTALAAGNGYVYVGTDNGLVRIAEARLGR